VFITLKKPVSSLLVEQDFCLDKFLFLRYNQKKEVW